MLEGYLLLEPDIANNSSAEVTVLLKAIDWAEEELARQGKSLPEHLILEVPTKDEQRGAVAVLC